MVEDIDYVLDTNILIYISKRNEAVVKLVGELDGLLGISIISYIEFMIGVDEKSRRQIENFLKQFVILELNTYIADRACSVMSQRSSKSTRDPRFADIIIGSTAELYNVPLVTNNKKDFKVFEHLQIISLE